MTTGDLIPAAETTEQADVRRLHQLGYAQELRRRMGGFSNFAVSFTIISILSGCLTPYGFGMTTGGPVDMTMGWPFVGGFDIRSGCDGGGLLKPSHGGWPVLLVGQTGPAVDRDHAAWSWYCGWFNLLGQVAVTAGIDFGFAAVLHRLFEPHDGLGGHPPRQP